MFSGHFSSSKVVNFKKFLCIRMYVCAIFCKKKYLIYVYLHTYPYTYLYVSTRVVVHLWISTNVFVFDIYNCEVIILPLLFLLWGWLNNHSELPYSWAAVEGLFIFVFEKYKKTKLNNNKKKKHQQQHSNREQ